MVSEIELQRQNKFNREIGLFSCSAVINDSLEKLENYDDQPEVRELIAYLQNFLDKLDL